MYQTISFINWSGACYFYTHQTSGAYAGVCACDSTYQTEKTALCWKVVDLRFFSFRVSKIFVWCDFEGIIYRTNSYSNIEILLQHYLKISINFWPPGVFFHESFQLGYKVNIKFFYVFLFLMWEETVSGLDRADGHISASFNSVF